MPLGPSVLDNLGVGGGAGGGGGASTGGNIAAAVLRRLGSMSGARPSMQSQPYNPNYGHIGATEQAGNPALLAFLQDMMRNAGVAPPFNPMRDLSTMVPDDSPYDVWNRMMKPGAGDIPFPPPSGYRYDASNYPGEHNGLSELGQNSLLTQVARALAQGQMQQGPITEDSAAFDPTSMGNKKFPRFNPQTGRNNIVDMLSAGRKGGV